MHLIGWLFLHHLVVFFLVFWSVLLFEPWFFVWAGLLCSKGWSLRYSPGRGNQHHCIVMLYVGEGPEREQCRLLSSQLAFSHFLCYPQANWALLVLIPGWVGLCMFEDPVGLSNELSCEAGSFSCHLNRHRFFQSEVLRLYFPVVEPWVVWSLLVPWLPRSYFSWFICTQIWDCLVHQLLPCHKSSSPWLPVFAPPTSVDEGFFFNSLVVRLPYSSIFWQLWLLFVFKCCCTFCGCARRHSVSTYASILAEVLSSNYLKE